MAAGHPLGAQQDLDEEQQVDSLELVASPLVASPAVASPEVQRFHSNPLVMGHQLLGPVVASDLRILMTSLPSF